MKGVVFNVVHEVVDAQLGPATWDDAIDRSGVEGVYTSLGNYPDAELGQLVGALAHSTRLSDDEVLVFAGRHGFERLAERHPDLVAAYDNWPEVIEHLDDIIHPEVAKIYPGVEVPSFEVVELADRSVRVVYRSRRQLCALAEGLLRGLGTWFRCELEVEHVECERRGDASCTLAVFET